MHLYYNTQCPTPLFALDPGKIKVLREPALQGRVRDHQHHGADGGAPQPVQRPGGGAPETDELRLRPDRTLRLHEASLHPGIREYAQETQDRHSCRHHSCFFFLSVSNMDI